MYAPPIRGIKAIFVNWFILLASQLEKFKCFYDVRKSGFAKPFTYSILQSRFLRFNYVFLQLGKLAKVHFPVKHIKLVNLMTKIILLLSMFGGKLEYFMVII